MDQEIPATEDDIDIRIEINIGDHRRGHQGTGQGDGETINHGAVRVITVKVVRGAFIPATDAVENIR